MAQNIDLTLPATAPAVYLSQERETDNFILPLYTLLPLSDDELRNIARACESDAANEEGDLVRLAPEPRINSQSLRAVYDRHLELGVQGEFDPVHFAVVVDQDWKTSGVLLVTLEDDDEPPAVSSFMCRPEGIGLAVQNLQIANMTWEDCEEMWGIVNDDGSGDDDDDEDEDDEDEEKKDEFPTDAEEGQSDDEGPAYPPKTPAYDYLIPIYILESADADAVIASLEEDADGKPDPFTDYRIRNQANLKPTEDGSKDMAMLSKPDPTITNDLVAQACALHPIRCRANKWLNKTHLLVCDTTQPSQSGILIVKLAWDGITTGRSKATRHRNQCSQRDKPPPRYERHGHQVRLRHGRRRPVRHDAHTRCICPVPAQHRHAAPRREARRRATLGPQAARRGLHRRLGTGQIAGGVATHARETQHALDTGRSGESVCVVLLRDALRAAVQSPVLCVVRP
jgi:hypothetical protein